MANALPSALPCCASPCSGLTVTVLAPLVPTCFTFLSGHGSPEGTVTGLTKGQTYLDLDTGTKWAFAGTAGTTIGWV